MADDLIPCIIYAARSAPDEKDRSTGSQTDEVRARIDTLGGREVINEFAESGVSGYSGERGPELDAAMDAAKEVAASRSVEAELLVFHSSRLARGSGRAGRRSLIKIYADLLYQDVQIRSVGDDEFMRNPMLVGVASEQNFKYSQDHGAHVARGKRSAFERGEWPGGPVPDGYIADRNIDERGRKVVNARINPKRAPIVEMLFEMSEQGIGDPTIARRMNEAGHRTKTGKPWSRRTVQHTLLNQAYAGRVVRYGLGAHKAGTYKKLDTPLVRPGLHPPLIEPVRFDRIVALRATRDKSKGGRKSSQDRGRMGGRPTSHFVLAKLAICDRCGARMYAVTSTYKRKDGTHQRYYQCANVRLNNAICDQPKIPSGPVDMAVIEYLDKLFVDVQAWSKELAAGSADQRKSAQIALDAEVERLVRIDRTEGKLRQRYLAAVSDDDETAARLNLSMLTDLEAELDESRSKVAAIRAKVDALQDDEPPTDVMLDLFNELRAAVTGGDGSVAELNERLREEFEKFRLDYLNDGTVGILPVLRERTLSGVEIAALYGAWHDGGEQAPTAEEIADYEAREGRDLDSTQSAFP
jgi:DNA invertase Pin-like site-specific DNA recombinase